MGSNSAEVALPVDLPELSEGWNYSPLARLVDQARGICYGIVQPGSHAEDGVPIVRVNNIRKGRIATEDVLRVQPQIEAKYERSRLRGGEVLLTLVGSLGESAIVPGELAGWNVARAVGIIPVRADIGPRWVELCLRFALIQHFIRTWATTTVQATFNLRDVARLPIPMAPEKERKAITCILGALDDKIELNRQRNRTLEAMVRAIFQSWFVDFDPVRAKAAGRTPGGLSPDLAVLFPNSFEDSALGPIPTGWRVGPVREQCSKVENGGTPNRQIDDYWAPSEVPWLTSGEVRQQLVVGTENHIPKLGLEHSSAKVWPPFTTVVALYGATAGIATMLGIELCANQACCGLVPRENTAFFIHQTLVGSLLRLQQQARGSAQQNVSQTIVADLQCVRPSDRLLSEFDNRIRPIYHRCVTGVKESCSLSALRDALLPKLISGELRVPDAERIVGRAT